MVVLQSQIHVYFHMFNIYMAKGLEIVISRFSSLLKSFMDDKF